MPPNCSITSLQQLHRVVDDWFDEHRRPVHDAQPLHAHDVDYERPRGESLQSHVINLRARPPDKPATRCGDSGADDVPVAVIAQLALEEE